MIQAGQLNQRITFQRQTVEVDPAWGKQGKAAATWTDICTRWAKVEPAVDTEKTANGQTLTQSGFTITARYIAAGIDEKCRILWKGQTLEIVAVNDPDNLKRELLISAVFTGGVQ